MCTVCHAAPVQASAVRAGPKSAKSARCRANATNATNNNSTKKVSIASTVGVAAAAVPFPALALDKGAFQDLADTIESGESTAVSLFQRLAELTDGAREQLAPVAQQATRQGLQLVASSAQLEQSLSPVQPDLPVDVSGKVLKLSSNVNEYTPQLPGRWLPWWAMPRGGPRAWARRRRRWCGRARTWWSGRWAVGAYTRTLVGLN